MLMKKTAGSYFVNISAGHQLVNMHHIASRFLLPLLRVSVGFHFIPRSTSNTTGVLSNFFVYPDCNYHPQGIMKDLAFFEIILILS